MLLNSRHSFKLLVSDSFPPIYSGVAKHSFYLAKYISADVLTGKMEGSEKYDEELQKGGLNVFRVGKLKYFVVNGTKCWITVDNPIHLWNEIRNIVPRYKYLIIQGPGGLTLPYFVVFSKRCDAKIIGIFHSKVEGFHPFKILKPFFSRFFRIFDSFVAVSETARKEVEMFGFNVDVIPPGVDDELFTPNHPPRKDLLDGRKTILFVGRLDKRKGFDLLLKSFHILRERRKDIKLVVVGNGAKISGEGVIHIGHCDEKELPSYYSSADVCVFPSRGGESFGIVLIEAFAMRKPVIAGNIEGYRNVIRNFHNGILVDLNPYDIAQKIEMVLDDENLGERISENAFLEVKEKYSWKIVAKKYEELFRNQ